jgi:hypothetical protein
MLVFVNACSYDVCVFLFKYPCNLHRVYNMHFIMLIHMLYNFAQIFQQFFFQNTKKFLNEIKE